MKLLRYFTFSLLSAVPATTAFLAPSAPQTRPSSSVIVVESTKLNDIDEMCIENVAELCLKAEASLAAECDLEEHEALVNQLDIQKQILQEHLDQIDNLLHRLKADGLAKPEPEDTYFAG